MQKLASKKVSLEAKHEALLEELRTQWKTWDSLVDRGHDRAASEQRAKVRDKMVDVLNRRNYIRNLVRDVNEALDSSS